MDIKGAYAMIPLEQYDSLRKENEKLQTELKTSNNKIKVYTEEIDWLRAQIQMLKCELEGYGVHRI